MASFKKDFCLYLFIKLKIVPKKILFDTTFAKEFGKWVEKILTTDGTTRLI